jgi:hypothetical protein
MNHIPRIFWIVLALSTLHACAQAPVTDTPITGAYPPDKPTQQPTSMIRFVVDVPGDTPTGNGLDIVLLDEVTGLQLNPERYPMRPIDGTHYTATMPFPKDTAIKYRYARAGNLPADEFTSNGKPVRYRLYHVRGQATVNDIVARWSDTQLQRKTGRLYGTIGDGVTGAPLQDILIFCGGMQATTRSDGTYAIDGLPAGLHNMVAYTKDGSYLPFQQGALVGESRLTEASFFLPRPHFVNIAFTVSLPPETPEKALVHFAGNLKQLGNTFSDLNGGVNGLAQSMPVMPRLSDGRYGLTLSLPPGTDLRYKYTLGDGFWNAERDLEGRYRVRQLTVPGDDFVVKDQVITWRDSAKTPMVFDYFDPLGKSSNNVTIQFNAYGWTQGLSAWPLGGNRWTYTLYNPLKTLPNDFKHRFCTNGSCGGN